MKHPDTIPVRLVILFVGAALLISLLISAYLIWSGKPTGEMTSVTLACTTGLLALLGQTRNGNTRESDNKPVPVTTPPGDPLDVKPVSDEEESQ